MQQTEQPTENKATRLFKQKSQTALSRIDDLDGFRASDNMIDFVFKIGRELFDTPLDQQPQEWLVRTGGRLTGVFAYLGQKSARARAERDVYEQKREEVISEMMLNLLDEEYKVTEARAKIKKETGELDELVIEKEANKNRWENLVEATKLMVMFIQSAIKVKGGEKFTSNQMYDNAN